MAKVLLVDTNFSSRPIFDLIKDLGHDVHVVGGNSSDCLAKICSSYWNIDYSNVDALADLVERERFDFLIPGCTDRSYRSCAQVSNGKFPGIDIYKNEQALNNKAIFRTLAQELGLTVPKLQWLDSSGGLDLDLPETRVLRGPLVVKPVDGYSGRGVTVLMEVEQGSLENAISNARNASASGNYLIEDYIDGQLFSFSANIESYHVLHDVIAEEHCTVNPFVVDTSWVLPHPSITIREHLRREIETIARNLELSDGLVHVQFIVRNDIPWIIDLTRRCPGDLFSQLVELSGDQNYVRRYVNPFLDLPPPPQEELSYRPIMRHTVSVMRDQSLGHLSFIQPLHLVRWVPLSLAGDYLLSSPKSRVGIFFAGANSEEALRSLCSAALAGQLYRVNH